jgi:hypothetical protein
VTSIVQTRPTPDSRPRIRLSEADGVTLIPPDYAVRESAHQIAEAAARLNRVFSRTITQLTLVQARLVYDDLVRQIEALEPRLMASPLPEADAK